MDRPWVIGTAQTESQTVDILEDFRSAGIEDEAISVVVGEGHLQVSVQVRNPEEEKTVYRILKDNQAQDITTTKQINRKAA